MAREKYYWLSTGCLIMLLFSNCHKKPEVSREHFENIHCVMVVVEPLDVELYESLLPNHKDFSMPEKPLVGIYISYFAIPSIPFLEGGITLRCKYKGEEGWTLLTNTVAKSERIIYYAAVATGFPKFKSDEISLMPSGEGWKGDIIREGKNWLSLEMTPGDIDRDIKPWQEKFLSGEKYKLDDPLFLLIPPMKGPYAYMYDLSSLSADSDRKITKGMVKIETDFKEEWTRLVPAGTEAPGLFFIDYSK